MAIISTINQYRLLQEKLKQDNLVNYFSSLSIPEPTDFKSVRNIVDYITDDVINFTINEILNGQDNMFNIYQYYYNFVEEYDLDMYPNFYNKEWFEENEIEYNLEDFGSKIDNNTNFTGLFTEKGLTNFKIKLKEYCLDDFENNFNIDYSETGNVLIYRSVSLNEGNIKSRKNVGIYWSFSETAAESHWGETGDDYIICGEIRLQDIDWIETFSKQIYSLWEEQEITAKENSIIKVDKIYGYTDEEVIELDYPIFLKA